MDKSWKEIKDGVEIRYMGIEGTDAEGEREEKDGADRWES